MVGKAYILPNPDEYYPSVDEFVGRTALNGKISTSRNVLMAAANPASHETTETPVSFIGNFPVMAADRNAILWGNACNNLN